MLDQTLKPKYRIVFVIFGNMCRLGLSIHGQCKAPKIEFCFLNFENRLPFGFYEGFAKMSWTMILKLNSPLDDYVSCLI